MDGRLDSRCFWACRLETSVGSTKLSLGRSAREISQGFFDLRSQKNREWGINGDNTFERLFTVTEFAPYFFQASGIMLAGKRSGRAASHSRMATGGVSEGPFLCGRRRVSHHPTALVCEYEGQIVGFSGSKSSRLLLDRLQGFVRANQKFHGGRRPRLRVGRMRCLVALLDAGGVHFDKPRVVSVTLACRRARWRQAPKPDGFGFRSEIARFSHPRD